MPDVAPDNLDDVLDRCIDVLLAGGDWEDSVATDHPDHEEVIELARVAALLSDAFGSESPELAPESAGGHDQTKHRIPEWIRRSAPGDTA